MAGNCNTLDTFDVYSIKCEDRLICYRLQLNKSSPWRASGGIVSYRGKRMLLTTSETLGECDDKYEITKSDTSEKDQDDEYGEEAEAKERQRSVSDAGEVDGSEFNSFYQPKPSVIKDPSNELMSLWGLSYTDNALKFIDRAPEFIDEAQEFIGRAKAIVRVDKLDYALIDVTEIYSTQIPVAIPLDTRDKIVAHCEEPMRVTTVTPSGDHIQGTRMPTLWEVRARGSNEDLKVYAARFAGSLGPGYTGSWVLEETTQKLVGHIITVRFFEGSEVALIVPAIDVFGHACKVLDPPKEINQGIVGGPECIAKVAGVENKGQAEKARLYRL